MVEILTVVVTCIFFYKMYQIHKKHEKEQGREFSFAEEFAFYVKNVNNNDDDDDSNNN